MIRETPSKHAHLTTEEEYFHRLDAEALEQLRKRAASEEERLRLAEASHVKEPAILDALARLGFHQGNVMLIPLVPLIQVAWADGSVSHAERDRVVRFARRQEIQEGTLANQQLAAWLEQKPSNEIFQTARRALRTLLDQLPESQREARKRSLHQSYAAVASASGGLLGLTRPICPAEQELLDELGRELE